MSEATPAAAARFNARAADYAKYRPSYPVEAIDAILAGLGPPEEVRAVDVGAGTGIGAKLLADRGVRTIAVEPNAEMRGFAEAAGLRVHNGSAAALGLPDASADLLCVFQAFHWFAEPESVAEFTRVLRPGGRLALVWNERDDRFDFSRGYGEIVDHFGDRMALAGYRDGSAVVTHLLKEGGLLDVRWSSFPNAQRFDYDGVIGRVRSASYVPREGPEFEAMIEKIDALFARIAKDGTVDLVLRTDVVLSERP